jgi:hypothetical protein
MFVNAALITFVTMKHHRAPNVKHSLRLWLDPHQQMIVFVPEACLKIAVTIYAQHAPTIRNSK